MIRIVMNGLTGLIGIMLIAISAVAAAAGSHESDSQTLAQRNYYPTEICANQVVGRFNLPWSDVEVRQDRYLGDGAVLVNWRTRRESGFCEVSARGDLLRFVVESNAGIGHLDGNPLQVCADEVARQRNVAKERVEVDRRSVDGRGRVTVAWRTRTEQGYCEVSARGRVEYFKVTQTESDYGESDYGGRYSKAERVCQDAAANRRGVSLRDVNVSSAGFSGKRLRVDWRTPYESGYCEIDRKNKLRDFKIVRQDRPQSRGFRSQENSCERFVASRFNLQRDAVRILSSQEVAGSGSETVRIDWRVGSRDGYCLIRRGIVIGSSIR